ncbi:efflux RND transporter periplasmic adaptor subunit [Bowmanella sp. JS7-9]|uniref:Efflux RND transporter periplasmic adaptor subunit n=1 Tax=Pseudobowmanella zhangzhouensis TaxID=1537679 RepID=A0ABW1XN72_9ALTE|nr:efflux RND transporter periplasmic adaptor subunit [Bowmanella sp. JS7-9]TBX20443.1 membrane protein [Bowmanella sp. JS7-9]
MKSNPLKVALPVLILLGAIAVMAIMIMSKQPPEKKSEPDKGFLVNTMLVEKRDVQFVVPSQGTLLPKVETNLVSQVSARVLEVAPQFIEGGFFKQGDVLVQLEQADYITDLKLAEAELARVEAALQEEIARGKVAAEEWKTVKSSVAPELGLRKPQLATAQANLRAAKAQYERAQRNLERTTIRAPFDGLVKSKNVDIGQFVGMGSQMGVLYATDIAEVRLPLSDNELAYLQQRSEGQSIPVTLTARVAGKAHQWQAELVRNEGVVDQSSRVIYVVAELRDPYARNEQTQQTPIQFGRFVNATITGSAAQDVVVVPRHVVRMDGTLLVTDATRKLMIREVDILRSDEDNAYISSGVQPGELIITSAVPNAVDGMALRLPSDKVKDDNEEQVELASKGVN